MNRTEMKFSDHYGAVMNAMTTRGLMLGSYDAVGKANVMTIGWGSIGFIWGVPIWTILVRPSRHTRECIEHTGCFTVNVPTEDMFIECAASGINSGVGIDKFAQAGLTVEKAGSVLAPRVGECPIIYECQTVHSNDVMPQKLANEILSGSYIDGDYHRVYFGKILAALATDNAAELL